MKKIMIAFAWTVCVLTACDKNKPSQTEMQALPVDVAKPLVENVTLTKDYPGYLEAESTVDLVGRFVSSNKTIFSMTSKTRLVNPEKPDVPLNKNDAFQKVQKRRVQEKR